MVIEKGASKEKLIYIHVVNWGCDVNDPRFEQDPSVDYVDTTNDWYVIKQSGDEAAQISRVFKDIKQHNDADGALMDTACEVIGSSIYVIGGLKVLSRSPYHDPDIIASNAIRCLDTRNLRDGWKTCFTLPFFCTTCASTSTSTADGVSWLFLLGGYCYNGNRSCREGKPWGYAVNINGGDGDSYSFCPPTNVSEFHPKLFPLSPTTFLALRVVRGKEKCHVYQFDCSKRSWSTHHQQMDSPFYPLSFTGGHAVSDDGIFYIYDTIKMKLHSYDLADQLKELFSVDIPYSYRLCRRYYPVKLFVLAKNKFCTLWSAGGREDYKMLLMYNRFSVYCSSNIDSKPDSKPTFTVEVEESRSFLISGFEILNIVTMDPYRDSCSDEVAESSNVLEMRQLLIN